MKLIVWSLFFLLSLQTLYGLDIPYGKNDLIQYNLKKGTFELISNEESVVFGDDFSQEGKWNEFTKDLLHNKSIWPIIKDGKSFKPIESFSYASRIFIKKTENETFIALFNYGDENQDMSLSLQKLGLDKSKKYELVELFDGAVYALTNESKISIPPKHAKLFKVLH